MGLIEFSKLPVNTLVGADWRTFKRVTEGQHISADKRTKYHLTKAICRLLSVMTPIQNRRYRKQLADKPLRHDPVFILGHWRSGTTFVHNVLAQDTHFGYTTTYQTVFPHYLMAMQWLFKPIFSRIMPNKRPTDNMELNVNQPQEEELALQNMFPYSYYNFWVFPEKMQEYCDRFLTIKDARPDELEEFKEQFMKLVKLSLWNTCPDHPDAQYLSKNPPHTGRIKTLLEMFPNAKFIYLMRNPYTVFESTRSFFSNTIQPLQFHHITDEQMEQNILRNYVELYDAYEEQKQLIPEGNLLEIKFEDIETDAFSQTERIYRELNIPGWEEAKPAIERYLDKKKGYKKNKYEYNPRTIQLVNQHWSRMLREWDYDVL